MFFVLVELTSVRHSESDFTMRNVFTVGLLLIGIFCVGCQSNTAEMMEDMKAKLSTLETYHRSLRENLVDEQHVHKRAKNVLEFCEELNSIVDRQVEVLKNLKQSLHDNLCPGPKEAWPCFEGNYTVISDSGRSSDVFADVGNRDLCDIDLQPGWYRFYLHGENAVMPTSCVPEFHCRTDVPLWLDLQNNPLPHMGQETQARACAHWAQNCCLTDYPISVRNCGDFFVYKLEPVQSCSLAYCSEPQT